MFLAPATIKLLGSAKSKTIKDKDGENMPYSDITEVVLVHYNIVNNDYQQDSRVLYTFVPNKSIGQFRYFTEIFYILKIFDSEFSYIEVLLVLKYYLCITSYIDGLLIKTPNCLR